MADQFNTDLLDVYLLWKEDSVKYNDLMNDRVSKIINYLLSRSRIVFYPDERIEDFDDLLQEAKTHVFTKVLPKIEDPTSKRIFNYIETSLRYKFKLGGRKRIAKTIDNNFIELQEGINSIHQKDEFYNRSIERNDAILDDCVDRMSLKADDQRAVKMLMQGFDRSEIMEEYCWIGKDWDKFRKRVSRELINHGIYTPKKAS